MVGLKNATEEQGNRSLIKGRLVKVAISKKEITTMTL